MNVRAIFAIMRKDLKVVSQNKGVMLPIIIASLLIFGVFPWLVTLLPSLANVGGVSGNYMSDVQGLINQMAAGLQQELVGYDSNQIFIVYFLVYMMASLFLIVPLMSSSVIAADSFAGEKERKTMEALLYAPTTDRELFVAKLLSSWSAAIAVTFVGFALYIFTANAAGWSVMHRIFFPNAMWLALVFWVAPAAAGLGLAVMVIVSVRAQGFQDANQMGSFVVLPLLLLIFGQVLGLMYFSIALVFLLGLVFWLLDGLLIWLGSRNFRRGRLLGA